MESGFTTIKDVLEVVVIPIAIFGVGALLPRWFEADRRRRFLALIERELEEMAPYPEEPLPGGKWSDHLIKRFIHEEIFGDVTGNRDFLLSLPPAVTYNVAQLWIHYEKCRQNPEPDDADEHCERWCDCIGELCRYFDARGRTYSQQVYVPWRRLALAYRAQAEARQAGGAQSPSLSA